MRIPLKRRTFAQGPEVRIAHQRVQVAPGFLVPPKELQLPTRGLKIKVERYPEFTLQVEVQDYTGVGINPGWAVEHRRRLGFDHHGAEGGDFLVQPREERVSLRDHLFNDFAVLNEELVSFSKFHILAREVGGRGD